MHCAERESTCFNIHRDLDFVVKMFNVFVFLFFLPVCALDSNKQCLKVRSDIRYVKTYMSEENPSLDCDAIEEIAQVYWAIYCKKTF